jgi:diguanylate cyclase
MVMANAEMDIGGAAGIALARRVIDEMERQGLEPSPQNYEIWMNYLSGSISGLVSAVDEIIASGRRLNSEDMSDLYESYFAPTRLSSEIMRTSSRIAAELGDALESLKRAGQTTALYGQTLNQAADSLGATPVDPKALSHVVTALTSATNEMSQQNAALASRLAKSSSEVQTLRVSLVQARTEALRDSLTGLANRKLFDQTLLQKAREADAEEGELSLVFCDIDRFKSVNDTWGHQTGDQVIRFVASVLSQFAGDDHLVARYGGEEFAIIMPRTSLGKAAALCELIRSAVEAKRLVRRATGESIGSVTVSFGCTAYRRGENPVQFIARADEYLYASKKRGRNRVTSEAVSTTRGAAA